jgi:hypothetical protein
MESAPFAAYAGLALALVILQVCLFATGLRAFVAEERRKRAETAAQVLRSLAETKQSSGASSRHKLHKASVREPRPRSTCSTHKHTDGAASLRPRAISSTPERPSHKQRSVVGVGSSHARDGVRSKKLVSGCSFLPPIEEAKANTRFSASCCALPSRSLGQVDGPALAIHTAQAERPREAMAESGRPAISVSSGSRFYGNVVEEMARKARANRGPIAPPPTLAAEAASSRAEPVVLMRRTLTA